MHILLCLMYVESNAQSSISFKLQDLSAPEELLKTESVEDVFIDLLKEDYKGRSGSETVQSERSNILSHSFGNAELVGQFMYNPFFFGMCEAYSHHRPIVLSPDVVWTLIGQGFAKHINQNSERYRDRLVGFDGKKPLVVQTDKSLYEIDWTKITESFYQNLNNELKGGLADIMLCNFSTTGSIERMVSQVTLMESVKNYYDFIVLYSICGIPSVTLTGIPDDWKKIKSKLQTLSEYDLKWWTKRLDPILDQFIAASEGNADIDFWKRMIHITEPDKCGDPRVIDGWITDFYPYDDSGSRLLGGSITSNDKLPAEIVKVSCRSNDSEGHSGKAFEIWAGIWGLEQDETTFSLTPKLGWLVYHSDRRSLEMNILNNMNTPDNFYGIRIEVDSIPSVLNNLDHIYILDVTFRDKAHIPDWLYNKPIDRVIIRGDISLRERFKLKKHFRDVSINPGRLHIPVLFRRLFLEGKA